MSEQKIIKKSQNIIICFGGMAEKFAQMLPFEFMRYLSGIYDDVDMCFYVDRHQCWYHNGLKGITTNIDDTIEYLKSIINGHTYDKIIFMGVSAGGYAAILFGSLCGATHVVSFIPQTILEEPINDKFKNLRDFINPKIKYLLYGNIGIKDKTNIHHIHHCYNISDFDNVTLKTFANKNVKVLRNEGTIKKEIDEIFHN